MTGLVLVGLVTIGPGTLPHPGGTGESRTAAWGRGGGAFVPTQKLEASRLRLGVTHTQFTADSGGDLRAASTAQALLSSEQWFQNQHIMGWGALNPEPEPGRYSWESLDARMSLIRRTGGIPVITLCCAPDWMKGGQPGKTRWERLEDAPLPQHYADFAELVRQVALRYPDVRHFQVWNELKGFWNSQANRWDVEGYTQLYNLVYDALKSVNPANQVGGPYVVIDSYSRREAMSHPSQLGGPWGWVDQRSLDVVDYWLQHKRGADFIALDLSTGTTDRGLVTDEFTALGKFSAIASWVRERTNLPLWWAEAYPLPDQARTWDLRRQAAVVTAAVAEMAVSGADVVLLWGPQADRNCWGCLWSDTRNASGGHPSPAFSALTAFMDHFPPGTRLVRSLVSSGQVTALASADCTVLINHLSTPLRFEVNGAAVELGPYEIRTRSTATAG